MKLVETCKGLDRKSIVAVFTGNGKTESDALRPLAHKYDGTDKILLLPRTPIHFRPDCGLSALKALKIYLSKYGIAHTLFLVDKEHFGEKDIAEEIGGVLKGFGINVTKVESPEELRENGIVIDGLVGGREVTIYVVVSGVSGETKCLEEDIAKLVELELGEKVPADKKIIRRVLHEHRLNIITLVEEAREENLTKAFPGLIFILRQIKESNVQQGGS